VLGWLAPRSIEVGAGSIGLGNAEILVQDPPTFDVNITTQSSLLIYFDIILNKGLEPEVFAQDLQGCCSSEEL
jgi:hypothetical protein